MLYWGEDNEGLEECKQCKNLALLSIKTAFGKIVYEF